MVLKDTIANSIISLEEAISNIQPGGLISPNGGSIVTIEDVAEPGIGGEINLTTGIDEGLEHNPSTKINLTNIRPSAGGPTWSEFSVSLKPFAQENPYVRFLMQASAGSSATVYAGISGTPLDVEEPIAPTNAATKGYVDNFVPDRIKGGAGTTYEETEIGVGPDATGHFASLLRGVNRGDVFLEQLARENSSGTGYIGWRNTRSGYDHGYVEWSTNHALLYGGVSGRYGKVQVDGSNGGNVYFDIPGASAGGGHETSRGLRLGSHISHTPNVRALPSHVNSILHGIKLGVDAHDELANYDWSEYPAVQDVDLNTFKITNLVDPTDPQDAATKAYVDANSGGGSGPPSKIESPSGNTSVESIDFSSEEAGTIMKATRGDSESVIAVTVAEDEIDPLETQSEVIIGVHNPNGPDGAWFEAKYLTRDNRLELVASGAPLNIEEPVEGHHAATKAYVDSQSGGGGDSSLLTSDDANTFITASNDSLLIGFDQYSKKLVVEELSPNDPEIMLSKSIETWDDIAGDEAIWGSVDGLGQAFMRTNYAFVEDPNEKSWGFQFINNVFEGHSHQGINISQGDHRLTFATVDTSSGDFYLASNTQDYWSRLDIRKDNIEIRASRNYNETSFRVEPSGSFTNKPLNMGNNRITNVEDPMFLQDVATKAYVDAQAGGGGTPGHVICNVIDDYPPLEPVPQRKNLVFVSNTADVVVQDFEELDTTIVNFSSDAGTPDEIRSQAENSPPGYPVTAYANVNSQYHEDETGAYSTVSFGVGISDHIGGRSDISFFRQPHGGKIFRVSLDDFGSGLVFEANDHPTYGDKEFRLLNAPTVIETPVKPDHAATKGYVDASRSDLEWWTPSWTPIENVGSVSNVECSYTRTYRAAGGSLVTLEGTIEVTPVAGDARSTASAILPIPRVGTDIVGGVATYTDYDGDDFGIARVGIADLGAGHQFTVQYTPDTSVVHRVSFRISYRAA